MKLITRDMDYAIRAISCIASTKEKTVTVAALSKRLDMPKPFLRKILQNLNKKGLLKSSKGAGGGFSLVVNPGRITVFHLMEIFQGRFQISEHTFRGKLCPQVNTCKLKKRLDSMENFVEKELKSITIESLI